MNDIRTGAVLRQVVAPGSKSEHDAVILEAEDQAYILRRVGGNPFADEVLDDLVGKRIEANGMIHGSTFLMSDWNEVSDDLE